MIATKNSQAQWHSYNVNSIAEGDCLFEFNITVSLDILSLFCQVLTDSEKEKQQQNSVDEYVGIVGK